MSNPIPRSRPNPIKTLKDRRSSSAPKAPRHRGHDVCINSHLVRHGLQKVWEHGVVILWDSGMALERQIEHKCMVRLESGKFKVYLRFNCGFYFRVKRRGKDKSNTF